MMDIKNKIIITGASGWIGKNVLDQILNLSYFDKFNQNIIAFGSKDGYLDFYPSNSNRKLKVPIYSLSNINKFINSEDKLLIIHCAFLLKNKLNSLNIKKYISVNREIISLIKIALKKSAFSKIVLMSSGVVERQATECFSKSLFDDPYQYLKHEEEKTYKMFANQILILRVFALTGKFMNNPNTFAFGNFLNQAIKEKRIKLESNKTVIRGYAFASDIGFLALSWLLCNDCEPFSLINCVSDEISLELLADQITAIYNLQKPIKKIDLTKSEDTYSACSQTFIEKMKFYGRDTTPFKTQIIESFEYLKKTHNQNPQ